jgi:hypothetical protein
MPDKVKENYILELGTNNFGFSELLVTEKNWSLKKLEESVLLGIKPQNTPAALLEKWTLEFRSNNF